MMLFDRAYRIFGLRALSFSDPYCFLSFCHSFCLFATLRLIFSETRPDSEMVPMDSLYKLVYGLSFAHAADDVM